MSTVTPGARPGPAGPVAGGPVLAALRFLGRVVLLPLHPLFRAWSRSPTITALVAGIALFIPVMFITPGSAGVDAVFGAVLTLGLILAFYLLVARGGPRAWAMTSLVAVGALLLDWHAFGPYWAAALVFVAASLGVGLGDRYGSVESPTR